MELMSGEPALPILTPIKLEETIEIPEPNSQPSSVVNPLKKILTLPRTQVNQPMAVKSGPQMTKIKSQMSSSFGISDVDVSISRADYLAEMADNSSIQIFGEMIASNFRGFSNRNKFVQQIFFLLGVLMCCALSICIILHSQELVRKKFENFKDILAIAFTLIAFSVLLFMLTCSGWVRKSSPSILALVLSSLSLTILYGVLSVHFEFIDSMIFITGSLMFIFMISSVLATQKKWEIIGKKMMVVLVVLTISICGVIASCAEYNGLLKLSWKSVLCSSTITMLVFIFVLLILRHMVYIEDLKVYEYVYATLVVYLSITTIYFLKTIVILCRTKSSDYERIAIASRVGPRRGI